MRRTGTGSRETWSLEKLSQGIKVRDKSGWSSFSVTFKLGRDGVCVCALAVDVRGGAVRVQSVWSARATFSSCCH